MRWCFDTSALIEPWVRLYPPDLFEPVWGKLAALAGEGVICAPVEVRIELADQKDNLFQWAKNLNGFFLDPTRDLLALAAQIVNDHPGLIKPNSPKSGADPFVIAQAELQGVPVVTYETMAKVAAAPRIPNVCAARGISYVSLTDVLRAEGFRL